MVKNLNKAFECTVNILRFIDEFDENAITYVHTYIGPTNSFYLSLCTIQVCTLLQ